LKNRGALPAAEIADILTQVARAVAKAHEVGIVHRDLKPENIFIVQNDDAVLAKVLDFGIAKITGTNVGASAPGTRSGALMGTPVYMSPEQAEGTKQVDYRSDLWSLGVIAYECLLGKRPFESEAIGSLVLAICTRPLPIPSQVGQVPSDFDAWFARACARDPGQRFPGAKEMARELRRILGGVATSRSGTPASPVAAQTSSSDAPGSANRSLLAATTDPLSTSHGKRDAHLTERSRGARVAVMVTAVGALLAAAFAYWREPIDTTKPTESSHVSATSPSEATQPMLEPLATRGPPGPLGANPIPSPPAASAVNVAPARSAVPAAPIRAALTPSAAPAPSGAPKAAAKRPAGAERSSPSPLPSPAVTATTPTSTVNLGI
jgi:serine/threonine-protein kinase